MTATADHTTEADAITAAAGWDTAPPMLEGAMSLTMGARDCDLPYWFGSVAQGTLRDRARTGAHRDLVTPAHMTVDGPLREALVLELGFRSIAEEKATRILSHYVAAAPDLPEMDFFATQLMDEARHSYVFRRHLVDLGVPADTLVPRLREMTAEYTREILEPIVEFAVRTVRDEGDFHGGVAIFTIVVEGVLAPAAELSERKWSRLDPVAAEVARGAGIDEVRHLTVGSEILREHVAAHPEYKERLRGILAEGERLWDELPDRKYVMHREELFQEGMHQHADVVGDQEIWPGRRLLDTTPDERYDAAESWTDEMAAVRMAHMGLSDLLPARIAR